MCLKGEVNLLFNEEMEGFVLIVFREIKIKVVGMIYWIFVLVYDFVILIRNFISFVVKVMMMGRKMVVKGKTILLIN